VLKLESAWFLRLKLTYEAPVSYFAFNFNLRHYNEVRAHQGAPRATLTQAAAADRELVFPVCEAEPSACTDACLYRVELVMSRCMAWLQVSDAHAGSGALLRSANTKAAACESAITAARGAGGCDAAEHADCLHPVAHNFESLLLTHRRPVIA